MGSLHFACNRKEAQRVLSDDNQSNRRTQTRLDESDCSNQPIVVDINRLIEDPQEPISEMTAISVGTRQTSESYLSTSAPQPIGGIHTKTEMALQVRKCWLTSDDCVIFDY